MSVRRLSKAWIFVSHSTKDIRKVRLIRNYLERSGAEPLIFRLKLLDGRRPKSIETFLRAEIRARQFFLLCRSANALGSKWVQDEWNYVHRLPGKSIHIIDLDPPPRWTTPRAEIDLLLKLANITMVYPWMNRRRIRALVKEISSGVAPSPADVESWLEADGAEPTTIDHGILGIDDRPTPDGQDWLDLATATAEQAHTIVLCSSRELTSSPLLHRSPDTIRRLTAAYPNRLVLDLDETDGDFAAARSLRDHDWTVLAGPLREQLQQLVDRLRAKVGPIQKA